MSGSPDDVVDLFAFLGREATAGFDFDNWREGERTILQPALEARGLRNVLFSMGERDSFGPLSRMVKATAPDGTRRTFFYG